jgi:hypothetical protein
MGNWPMGQDLDSGLLRIRIINANHSKMKFVSPLFIPTLYARSVRGRCCWQHGQVAMDCSCVFPQFVLRSLSYFIRTSVSLLRFLSHLRMYIFSNL